MVSNNHREAVAVKDSSLVPMPVSVSQLLPTTPLSPSIEKGPDTCSVLLLPCFNWATLVDAVGEECLQDLLLSLHQWMEQHLGLYHVINKKNIVCIWAYLSVSLVGFICGVLFCKETNQRFGYFQVSYIRGFISSSLSSLVLFHCFFFPFFFHFPIDNDISLNYIKSPVSSPPSQPPFSFTCDWNYPQLQMLRHSLLLAHPNQVHV